MDKEEFLGGICLITIVGFFIFIGAFAATTSYNTQVSQGKKIVIEYSVYQCQKIDELDLKEY